MCERCIAAGLGPHSSTQRLRALVADAERVVQLAQDTPYQYRRPLSPVELEHGDVDRVRTDMDTAELRIVRAAAPVVRKAALQLAQEAMELAKAGDYSGVSKLAPSYVGELAGKLKDAYGAALKAGRAQVIDQHRKQTAGRGTQLAAKRMVPRKDPKVAGQYMASRAEVDAERISAQVALSIRQATLARMGREAGTDWVPQLVDPADEGSALSQAILAGERSLTAIASAGAREGIGMGRLFGFEEVRQDVQLVVYTAILDANVCEVCAPMDGQEYGPDEFGKAPNDGCLGGDRCRCFEVLVFDKGGQ